jgi:hypothetical protein
MKFIDRFFWIFFILGIVVNALSWYFHSLEFISKKPELESGYHMLILGFLFWGNIPWVVMGTGCLTQNMTLSDYLEPKSIHPSLIAVFSSLLLVYIVGTYWLFLSDGAAILVKYPGLLISESGQVMDSQSLSSQSIKLFWGIGVISGIGTMIFMLIKIKRISSDS